MNRKEKIKYAIDQIQKNNKGDTIDFVVPGYAAKKIVAYQSMREDLIQCKNSIIELLTKKNNDVVKSSLFYTVMALYGKCFTDATSTKSPKLELSDFKGREDLIPLHNEIMDNRHNLVAHRGSTENEFSFPYISLGVKDLSQRVRVKQIKRRAFNSSNISKYIELLDYLIKIVEDKFYKSSEKLWDHMLESFTADEIALMKIAGPVNKEN